MNRPFRGKRNFGERGIAYDTEMTATRNKLRENLDAVEERIVAACARAGRQRSEVTMVAVTKSVSVEVAALLPELGVCDLGESRPQELWRKAALVAGVRWHLIGHLQRNKLDRTLPLVRLIHSVDSVRLLEAIGLGAVQSNGYSFQIEMKYRAIKGGFRVEEVPITFVDRRVGASKMSRRIFVEALTMVWKMRLGLLERG